MSKQNLIEGLDFYFENRDGIKFKVFTAHYLSKRGFCCKNNCRHCPYGFKTDKGMQAKQTSLEEFNSLVDKHYTSLRQYIVSSSDKKIILEDYENYAWGKNPDLSPLFEKAPLPIKNMEVSYNERHAMFQITLNLK